MPLLSTEIDVLLQKAARLASEYLEGNRDRDQPVVEFLSPEALGKRLELSLPEEGRPLEGLIEDARTTLRYSVRTGHARFFNQLFGGYDPAAILGEWITALLNTSMYTFEAAPVATLMELELLRHMRAFVDFDQGEGVFAPGGSISNLMAVLAARHRALPECKRHGLQADDRLAMFVSSEAHYSLPRAAAIAGLGLQSVFEIETDATGRMRLDALQAAIAAGKSRGYRPFFVGATAGTTVPGAYDPIADIAEIAEQHDLWLHVDGAYGGSVLLSPKHRHLMQGIERADSMTWNPHKMMGVPLACSALLLREQGWLRDTFGMNADYLFHDEDASEFDRGDLTLQCGRRVDALKLWLSWQAHGDRGYIRRIDRLMEQAKFFEQQIRAREAFDLAREPHGPNVCFHHMPAAIRAMPDSPTRKQALSEHTVQLRQKLHRTGRFMINYATLDDVATFRIVLSNPDTTEEDLTAVLDEMEGSAQD